MLAILQSGKNVVTSICTGTHWGHLANGAAFKARLDAACKKGNSTVHFTGFDPGFTTDALAYLLSSVSGEIKQIRTWEIIDYSTYTGVDTLKQLGFGVRPEEMSTAGMAAIPTGWGGGIYLLAEAMGVAIEELKVAADIHLSPKTFTAPGGLMINEGAIGAIRWSLTGIVKGKPAFVVNHVNRMGNDMAPDWPQVGTDGGYRIEMDAFPPLHADFPMGLPGGTGSSFADAMAMTAARCVNAIEAVVQAQPGYRTFLDLASVGARYALAA
jgi:4-hydroxy-tetrahydrodipicolinate reductase